VWCPAEERKEKREEIEQAMAGMPGVLALIGELFEKSEGAGDDAEAKDALTREYGEKLHNLLLSIYVNGGNA
jgi:hypothetical protein